MGDRDSGHDESGSGEEQDEALQVYLHLRYSIGELVDFLIHSVDLLIHFVDLLIELVAQPLLQCLHLLSQRRQLGLYRLDGRAQVAEVNFNRLIRQHRCLALFTKDRIHGVWRSIEAHARGSSSGRTESYRVPERASTCMKVREIQTRVRLGPAHSCYVWPLTMALVRVRACHRLSEGVSGRKAGDKT